MTCLSSLLRGQERQGLHWRAHGRNLSAQSSNRHSPLGARSLCPLRYRGAQLVAFGAATLTSAQLFKGNWAFGWRKCVLELILLPSSPPSFLPSFLSPLSDHTIITISLPPLSSFARTWTRRKTGGATDPSFFLLLLFFSLSLSLPPPPLLPPPPSLKCVRAHADAARRERRRRKICKKKWLSCFFNNEDTLNHYLHVVFPRRKLCWTFFSGIFPKRMFPLSRLVGRSLGGICLPATYVRTSTCFPHIVRNWGKTEDVVIIITGKRVF